MIVELKIKNGELKMLSNFLTPYISIQNLNL